jgi:hypothetical protein
MTNDGIEVDDGLEISSIGFSIVLTIDQWRRFNNMGWKPSHWALSGDLSYDSGERRVYFAINISDFAKSVERAFEFAREFATTLRQQ